MIKMYFLFLYGFAMDQENYKSLIPYFEKRESYI